MLLFKAAMKTLLPLRLSNNMPATLAQAVRLISPTWNAIFYLLTIFLACPHVALSARQLQHQGPLIYLSS
jgi:hypothetical protein